MELNIVQKECVPIHDFSPFFKVHKNGHAIRCAPIRRIQPSTDDTYTGVSSKDLTISIEPVLLSRIFMPNKTMNRKTRLPILIYFHGGGFSLGSAFDPIYHRHLAYVVNEANVIGVSVEYRLAIEHPLPACYNDSWTALQRVASHVHGHGSDPWLNNHGDFQQVFLVGDSAGANIAHNMAVRAGRARLLGMELMGLILVHPWFGGIPKLDRMWLYMCPRNSGAQDPRLKPNQEDLRSMGCERVLVFVAAKDQFHLRDVGWAYYEELKKCGWKGNVEIIESEGVGHTFHLFKPKCEQALHLVKTIVSFINQKQVSLSCKM